MDRRIELVITNLEADTSRAWDAPALAKLVNLSPSRFRHLFKQETGVSPRQYLRELGFRRAEVMLATTFLSIKEIAEVVGLAPLNHFMRNFKRRHGVTPGEYRIAARLAAAQKLKSKQ
ncbi:MAG TPA: AraC family transcriptional regulator [Pyrinomonadaceae bacterium]|nr:AraC family transcriptional regulator [Pyrinomonadaceae bacterium]